jgi:hypothetical protein
MCPDLHNRSHSDEYVGRSSTRKTSIRLGALPLWGTGLVAAPLRSAALADSG